MPPMLMLRLWRSASIDGTVFDEAAIRSSADRRGGAANERRDDCSPDRPHARTTAVRITRPLAPGDYIVDPAAAAGAHATLDHREGRRAPLRRACRPAPTAGACACIGACAFASESRRSRRQPRPARQQPRARVARRAHVSCIRRRSFPTRMRRRARRPSPSSRGRNAPGSTSTFSRSPPSPFRGRCRTRGPVSNFGVRLLPADSSDDARYSIRTTTATDGRGAFTFPLVPSGRYTVAAFRIAPPPPPPGAPAPEPPGVGVWASQAIAVGDAPVRNVALTLRDGLTVSGHVEFQGASARPAGAQSQPRHS